MKNTIQIPKAELFDKWVEDESTIELSDTPTKHDMSRATYVTKMDGKHWRYSYERSYNEGPQIYTDSITATEVEPVEVTTILWRSVEVAQ